MNLSDQQVIDVFKALSDPNRMQIFELLMTSDRTNSELMEETGLRQNLLSHHLNIMTECGLIQTHRSIGDARRHYYSPRLEMTTACREWWAHHSPPLNDEPLPTLQRTRKVLFLCLRNGMRSYMAEALANHFASGALQAWSAGIEDVELAALALGKRVLQEHGINRSDFEPKTYEVYLGQQFDYVITVCDIVHEKEFPAGLTHAEILHWSMQDPLEEFSELDAQLAASRALYREIRLRLAFFVQHLAHQEAVQA